MALFLTAVAGSATPPSLADRVTLKQFPSYLQHLPKNKVLPDSTGTRICHIGKIFPLLSDCNRLSKEVEDFVLQNHINYYNDLRASCGILCDDGILDLGVTGDQQTIKQISIGFNPQIISNQKQALSYLEKTVLQNPHFFEQRSDQIVKAIKQTHRLLSEKLTNPNNQTPGQYRTKASIIVPPSNLETEDLVSKLRKTGANDQEIEIFKRCWGRHLRGESLVLTYNEINVLAKIIHFPVSPEEVPSAMLEFATNMKEMAKKIKEGTLDPIEAAAVVLYKMGDIHPFSDANGRLGRAWMNLFLQLGGIEGIIFPDDIAYTQALRDEETKPGSLAVFIRETIEWNRAQENLRNLDLNFQSPKDEL